MQRSTVFIFIAGLILIGGIVTLFNKPKANLTLRVAFSSQKAATEYEPTNIHFAYEYLFLENIFSSLVEINPSGQIVPAVAENFSWKGDELHLSIRPMQTENGTPITADDVAFSLKRLLVLSQNTHGNFKDLVCPGAEMKDVNQDCPGIIVEGSTVILKAGKRKSFLLPMLAAIDFAIIPKSSVDLKTLAITNYRQTSGVYFVDQDKGDGHIELKLNPRHFHAAENLAQAVTLVPIDIKVPGAAISAFRRGEVDHLMTSNSAKVEDILAFANENKDVQAHATLKIRKHMLVFTKRGQRELTLEQRRWIGRQVKASVLEATKETLGYGHSDQFFPSQGDGSLKPDELAALENILVPPTPVPGIRLAMIRAVDLERWAEPIKRQLPSVVIYQEKNIPGLHVYQNPDDEPHAFIASTDTGFMEDINLISYSLNAGFFGLDKQEQQQWLAHYMEIPNSGERLAELRKIHLETIENAISIPLVESPFIALVRRPWNMKLSTLFANNPLWLITRN